MNDLSAIAVFVVCLLATFGLLRLCDWLSPGSGPKPTSKGDRP